MCDELKLYCGGCKTMRVAEGNFGVDNSKAAVKNRGGYAFICKDCNRDVQVVKKAKKRSVAELESHIMQQLRVLNLNLKALDCLYDNEEGNKNINDAERIMKKFIGHDIKIPFEKI